MCCPLTLGPTAVKWGTDTHHLRAPFMSSSRRHPSHTRHICPCRHATQTSKLKPHAVMLMAVHPGSPTYHNCTPRSSHARSISAHAPHPVLIMCASTEQQVCILSSRRHLLTAELVLALQADPSLPHATHARWFTASRSLSLHAAHSLVMAPLALSVKSAIAAVTSVSSSSSKSPSAMW